MAAAATSPAPSPDRGAGRDRRVYQREVDRLLEAIRSQVGELQRLKAAGVTRWALADRKRQLEQMRRDLAALIGGALPAADPQSAR